MTENNKEVSDAIKGGLTSAWGWFNTAKEAVATTSAKMAEKLPEKMEKAIESMKAMEDKPKEDIDSGYVPWNEAPAPWSGREWEWEALVKAMVADEGTFLLGPDRGMTQSESRALRVHGITVDFSIENELDYTAKVSRAMLDFEPLGNMRFSLVPKFVSEAIFWRNLFWKLREFGKLDNTQAMVKPLLMVTNVQRDDIPDDWTGADLKKPLPDSVASKAKREQKIEEMMGTLKKEKEGGDEKNAVFRSMYAEGTEALVLLKECLDDGDMVEHLKVACDSCVSCRDKLQKEIEEQGTVGDDEGNFAKILTLIGNLDDAIQAYEEKAASGAGPVAAGPTSSPTPTDEDNVSSNVDSFVEVPANPTEADDKTDRSSNTNTPVPPETTVPASGSPTGDVKEFTALPWDTDEEDD
eukprot:TRINITY_DN7758_c0_g2_i2.p1 TRINITY_DN7758_c0_g2~~TRINITY_DN7758_c0_g2_i2.p1  ORF type:complete len:410 (+),score=103.37 TRINITY_DN7758_c0_g2_i2:48-1277(+)